MKKIFKYWGVLLSVALMGAFTSCDLSEDNLTADLGLGIKVFFPTKVVAGQPMTINGSGFSDVTEVVFPGDIVVTDFEIVSNEMIRVTAPAGINPEGGKILVRTADEETESRLPLTLGSTKINGYSKMAGETVAGGEQLTIYGEDLEFITSVELKDPDGNPLILNDEDFYRKGTSSVIITVPRKVFTGTFAGIIRTYDSREFTMDEFAYEEAIDAGYWEITKKILWESEGGAIPAWDSKYRFSNVEAATGEEIYAFPMEDWALIKDGVVRVGLKVNDASNIRITTGWWTGAYGGAEHNCIDFVQTDEDGNAYIELNLKEEGSLYDNIDAQHLLFTGSDYELVSIYVQEETWVEGEAGHWEKNSLWKSEGGAIPAWDSKYRFGLDGNDGLNECIATFSAEDWALIKDGVVRVGLKVNDASNIRITTGWWTGAYGGAEHNCIDFVQTDEDGNAYIELNIKEEGSLYDNIDVQHLLFTGSDYELLEIYTEVWVEGGAGPKEVVFWENPDPAGNGEISWNGVYRFALDGNDSLNECIATLPQEAWDVIKTGTFYLHANGFSTAQLRITDGWWSTTWTGNDIMAGDERLIDNGDGTFTLEINFEGDPLLDVLDAQHLLFTGGGYTPLRLYYME